MKDKVKYLFFASIFAILFALTLQYGFGKPPCELCIWQRIPYIAIIAITAISLLCRRFYKFAAIVGMILLFTELCLAGFHSGVEEHWWQGPSHCTGKDYAGVSLDDIKASIFATAAVKCDEKAYLFPPISIAQSNFMFVLAVFGLLFLRKKI
jgi:disulfide bond formation protein DsbB